MPDLIQLVLPVFLMIGIGAAMVRLGLFPATDLAALNRFVMTACIPVLLFSAVNRGDGLGDFAFGKAALYAAASLAAVFLLWLALRRGMGQMPAQALILSLAAGSSNSVFLGYPLAAAIIPDRAAPVFAWVVLAEILFVIPAMTTLALWAEQRADGLSIARTIGPLLRSPVTIGLLAGLAFLASGLVLPTALETVVRSIVQAAPFIALFLIGGMLVQVRITRTGPRVVLLSAAKLILHPVLMWCAFAAVFGADADATRDAVLFASLPIFATFVVFCARHGVGEVAASAVAVSTLLGIGTMTVIIGLMP